MRFTCYGCKVHISFYFVSIVTLMLACDKTGLCLWSFLSTLFHELGHIILYFVFHQVPAQIDFGIFGIRIIQKDSVSLSCNQDIQIAAAGPLVNFFIFLLLFFIVKIHLIKNDIMIMVAWLNFMLGLINCMPIEALDGGKILFLIIAQKKGVLFSEKMIHFISILLLCPLILLGLYFGIFKKNNPTILIMCVYLCLLLKRYR